MTTTVIVDDTDPGIHYIGDWELTGSIVPGSYEYNNTVHQGSTDGLALTYQFTGTRIFVYGTVDSPVAKGMANPRYSLDNLPTVGGNGADLSTIVDVQSHILLYQSPPLQDGQHTLNISLSNANTDAKFYFDFFTVDVSSAPAASHIIVDDQNPDIKYTGDWTDSHSFNEYLGTDRRAPDSGNANATYSFNGTSISVYGTLPANADPQSIIDFAIDSGQSTRFTAPFTIALFGRHTLLYSTSGLSQGPHTLAINAQNSMHWWLDYLIYTTTSSVSSSLTPDTGSSSSSGSSVPTGAIAGGAAGVIMGLVLIGGILFLFTRKWRRKQEISQAKVPESRQFQSTQAFPRTSAGQGVLVDTAYTPTSPGTGVTAVGGGMVYGDRKGIYQHSPATHDRPSIVVSDTIPSTLGAPGPTAPPRREVDGGVRLAGGSDYTTDTAPSTLPPSYAHY